MYKGTGTQKGNTSFWAITLPSPLKVNWHFRVTCCVHHNGQGIRHVTNKAGSKQAHSLTLKMEVTSSSKISVDFLWTTKRYIQEDGTLHNRRCEDLKSYRIENFINIVIDNFGLGMNAWYVSQLSELQKNYILENYPNYKYAFPLPCWERVHVSLALCCSFRYRPSIHNYDY